MLSAKENFLETLKKDGKPDRLVNQYTAMAVLKNDPCNEFARGDRKPGTTSVDRWGTTIIWPEGQPAGTPHITPENVVIKDIENWRDYVKVPDIVSYCSDPAKWEPVLKSADEARKQGKLVAGFMGTGVFEQMHFLMGFEEVLVNVLMEPECCAELAETIGEYRYQYAKLLVDYLKPDVIVTHDDWGSKNQLFMSPETWRKIIKPNYYKIYGYMKEHGVIVLHHSDSYAEPLAEDMVDIGIDIWQGVLPTNNIPKLVKELDGRMTLMGGVDSLVDRIDATEEEIRKEARRACEDYTSGGHVIPSMTYGSPGSVFPNVCEIISDEIERFNKEKYGICDESLLIK